MVIFRIIWPVIVLVKNIYFQPAQEEERKKVTRNRWTPFLSKQMMNLSMTTHKNYPITKIFRRKWWKLCGNLHRKFQPWFLVFVWMISFGCGYISGKGNLTENKSIKPHCLHCLATKQLVEEILFSSMKNKCNKRKKIIIKSSASIQNEVIQLLSLLLLALWFFVWINFRQFAKKKKQLKKDREKTSV